MNGEVRLGRLSPTGGFGSMGLGETEANCYLAFPLRDLRVEVEAHWVPPLALTQVAQVSM